MQRSDCVPGCSCTLSSWLQTLPGSRSVSCDVGNGCFHPLSGASTVSCRVEQCSNRLPPLRCEQVFLEPGVLNVRNRVLGLGGRQTFCLLTFCKMNAFRKKNGVGTKWLRLPCVEPLCDNNLSRHLRDTAASSAIADSWPERINGMMSRERTY